MLYDALIWILAGAIGAAAGSFLNVCIHRLPAEESVIRPRSRCPGCGAAIRWYDNVPVLSYLLLRGRCRCCRARISIQYPAIEASTALVWLGMVALHGPEAEALRGAMFLTLLLGIAVIDARDRIIPDQFSLGGAAVGLLFALVPGTFPLVRAVVGALVGYVGMRLIAYGGEKLFRKPALGLGDVHMMAMVGAFVGLSGAVLTVFLGSLLGLALGVPLAWARGRLSLLGTYLPLGTYLALGAAVAYVWGDVIVGWYLGQFTMP